MVKNEAVEKRWSFKRSIVLVNSIPVAMFFAYYLGFHDTLPAWLFAAAADFVVFVYFTLFIDKGDFTDTLLLGGAEHRKIRFAVDFFLVVFFGGVGLCFLISNLADRGILPNVDFIALFRNYSVALANLAAMFNIYVLGILYSGKNDLLSKVFLFSAVTSFAITVFSINFVTILALSALVVYWNILYFRFRAES